jgi:hypothetical protein
MLGATLAEPVIAAESALPDDAESLVLIRPLAGPEAEPLQLTVEAAVAENFSAVSASQDEEKELKKGTAALVRMSREKKYRAYVSGMIKAGPRGRLLVLVVHSGKDGKPVGEAKFPGPSNNVINAKVDKQAGPVLAKLLRKTAVAGGASDDEEKAAGASKANAGKEIVKLEVDLEEEEEPEAEAPEESSPDPGKPKSPADVHLGVGFTNLSLSYNQPITDAFGYQLLERPTTPLTVRVGGHVYPGAWFFTDARADIGLGLRYYRGLAGNIDVMGTPSAVEFSELDLGLRGRIVLDQTELGLLLGWGKTGTVVAGNDPGHFPDTVYSYLRFGVDARHPVTSLISVTGALGLRLPDIGKEPGELGETRWFPHATASGFDFELGAMYELVPRLSITAGVDVRVYGLTMHSSESDLNTSSIAGGASDRYLGGFAGIDYRL